MSVKRCQHEVDAEEFIDWVAFDRLSPIGDERLELSFGIMCSLVYNMKRTKRMPSKKASDFMPVYHVEARRQSAAEIQRRLLMFTKIHNIEVR